MQILEGPAKKVGARKSCKGSGNFIVPPPFYFYFNPWLRHCALNDLSFIDSETHVESLCVPRSPRFALYYITATRVTSVSRFAFYRR